MLILILSQVVQPQQQPDIQLNARVSARRVVVESRGQTSLTVRAAANGREGEGNVVEVEAPDLPQGRRELRNVEVRVQADARIPDPLAGPAPQQEPAQPE